MLNRIRIVVFCSIGLFSFLLTGCGNRTPRLVNMGGEDGQKIASVIEELNEAKNSSKKTSELFKKAQTVADAKKLNQYAFYVLGRPKVSGESATCKVQIEQADGTQLGDQEWTFEKVSDAWKIAAAPIP